MSGIKFLDQLFAYLPKELVGSLCGLSHMNRCRLQEIRLYAQMPVKLFFGDSLGILQKDGQTVFVADDNSVILSQKELDDVFKSLCEYSVHSYQEELARGFLTIKGGHRVGVFGTTVIEDGCVFTIKDISSLNIRIARQVTGVADLLYQTVFQNRLQSVLIVGAPGTGKTTLLRDLVRGISAGELGQSVKVAVIDERGELSAMSKGVPQYDLGGCTDVYYLCPKAKGMEMALRAGSPQLLVCDEIGGEDDVRLLKESMLSGVRILATAHSADMKQLQKRSHLNTLLADGIFDKIIFLENHGVPCKIEQLIDGNRVEVLL